MPIEKNYCCHRKIRMAGKVFSADPHTGRSLRNSSSLLDGMKSSAVAHVKPLWSGGTSSKLTFV
jgi:hypothetical protein